MIFQFLMYFLGLSPFLLWFVLGLISNMILRREENEIKRRFSIDGRKFGFSLFSALKRSFFFVPQEISVVSYCSYPIPYHTIWALFHDMTYLSRNEDRNQRLKERLQEKTTSFTENFTRRISKERIMRTTALRRSGTFKNIGNRNI